MDEHPLLQILVQVHIKFKTESLKLVNNWIPTSKVQELLSLILLLLIDFLEIVQKIPIQILNHLFYHKEITVPGPGAHHPLNDLDHSGHYVLSSNKGDGKRSFA